MTLQQIIYFLTAAERGSFNAAARALLVTQPAVSEQVRRLEDELGVALFVREGRGLSLTPAGRRFRGHAERVAGAADDAVASVGRGSFARERVITLGMFRNAPYYPIAKLIAEFAYENPEVRLRLPGQNSAETAAAVRSGELEAGVAAVPFDDDGLEVTPLFSDEVLYVSREPVASPTIADVAAAPLVLYDAGYGFEDPTRRQLAERAQRAGVVVLPRVEVEHVETALQLSAQGVGATMAARAVTLAEWFPPELTAVSFAEPLYDAFALITRRRARLSSGTRQLVDALESWAAGLTIAP